MGKQDTEYKPAPTKLKAGMPEQQHNGLFGNEARLIGLGLKGRFKAIVTFDVDDVKGSRKEQSEYPLVEFVHIEPLFEKEQQDAIAEIEEAAYRARTGADQLNFDGLEGDEKSGEDLGGGKKGQF